MEIIIDKTNLISGLEQILDYVKKWFKVKIQVEPAEEIDYEKAMKKIEEEMEKEGIKFERVAPEKVYESMKNNKKFFDRLKKEWLLVESR